jgi:large subunit ribosomal protein L18
MVNQKSKILKRKKRHNRVRRTVIGVPERLRLSVYRSHKNLYVQIIDDTQQKTLLSVSTLDKEVREKIPFGGNLKAAKLLGEILSRRAKEKSINKVILDRGAYPYHGRIKAFAETARAGGLQF